MPVIINGIAEEKPVIYPKTEEPEESIAEMEARIGFHGQVKPEFKGLETLGHNQRNQILEDRFGLRESLDGTLVDSETGEDVNEGTLYEK